MSESNTPSFFLSFSRQQFGLRLKTNVKLSNVDCVKQTVISHGLCVWLSVVRY